jgi:hypothetical protein
MLGEWQHQYRDQQANRVCVSVRNDIAGRTRERIPNAFASTDNHMAPAEICLEPAAASRKGLRP